MHNKHTMRTQVFKILAIYAFLITMILGLNTTYRTFSSIYWGPNGVLSGDKVTLGELKSFSEEFSEAGGPAIITAHLDSEYNKFKNIRNLIGFATLICFVVTFLLYAKAKKEAEIERKIKESSSDRIGYKRKSSPLGIVIGVIFVVLYAFIAVQVFLQRDLQEEMNEIIFSLFPLAPLAVGGIHLAWTSFRKPTSIQTALKLFFGGGLSFLLVVPFAILSFGSTSPNFVRGTIGSVVLFVLSGVGFLLLMTEHMKSGHIKTGEVIDTRSSAPPADTSLGR